MTKRMKSMAELRGATSQHIAGALKLLCMASLSMTLLANNCTAAAFASPDKLAASAGQTASDKSFNELADKYFDFAFTHNPDAATSLGIHKYDALTPDFSASAIQEEVAGLKTYKQQFEDLKTETFNAQTKIDLKLILGDINSRLLSLEQIKFWQTDPDMYSSDSSSMIYSLMTKDFAPLADRMKLAIEREKKIPKILRAGKANLKNPPKIYTEVALEQLPGIIDFFKTSVPEAFKSVSDKNLQVEFTKANDDVIAQLKDYQEFLKTEVLPRSNGSFAFGADIYSKKLLYDEGVSTSIDQLLADGDAELKRLQKDFVETAKQIDPSKSPEQVFVAVSSDHPKPEELIKTISGVLSMLKKYCVDKNIVSIPSEDDLKVGETPPFMRALTFASMDSPGPFETKAKEAYYYVTLPEPDWSAEKKEEHMRSFCKYDVLNTSVHEAFPGHYVQGLWNRTAPSKTTKIVGCGSNVEGWAHYTEQMMVEEGLDNNDPKLKLTMIHDALLRACRYMVGIKMHTKGMSMQEGIEYFIKEGWTEKANAERETKRGTKDATYLVYTLGKMQILALRDDYKRAKGDAYTLKDFHDRFLATGCPPVPIIREIMLGNNK